MALVILSACQKTSQSKLQAAYDYFPDSIGYWIDYRVDSIFIDQLAGIRDTFSYYLREEIGETFLDNDNRSAQKIYRFKKDSVNHQWRLADVWHFNKMVKSVERVEENLRFVKLIFPITASQTWAGNNYVLKENTNAFYQDWQYRYLDIHAALSIDSLNFDSTITVDQQDLLTDHFWYYGREIYAYKVGLVYKELINLTSDEALLLEDSWRLNAQKGMILTYKVVDYKR